MFPWSQHVPFVTAHVFSRTCNACTFGVPVDDDACMHACMHALSGLSCSALHVTVHMRHTLVYSTLLQSSCQLMLYQWMRAWTYHLSLLLCALDVLDDLCTQNHCVLCIVPTVQSLLLLLCIQQYDMHTVVAVCTGYCALLSRCLPQAAVVAAAAVAAGHLPALATHSAGVHLTMLSFSAL